MCVGVRVCASVCVRVCAFMYVFVFVSVFAGGTAAKVEKFRVARQHHEKF